MVLSGGSFAALRDLADYGACIAFDDAEGLSDPKKSDPDKRALLLAGNRRGAVVPLKDGRLMMLCRTDQGCQMRSFSPDGGVTWTPAELTDIASPVSPATIERIPDENPYFDWIRGIKTGQKPCSNFDYAGPFTEMVQFGHLVVKSGQKLHWDNKNGVVTNVPHAKEVVTKEYRKGWEIPC